MRTSPLIAAGLVGSLLATLPTSAAEPHDPFADFDAYVRSAMSDFRVPGLSVAVVRDGKVVLARGYGVCREGEDRRVDTETVFPIASVTKVFTATCLAQLVDEGRLNWNDPVVKHLSEFELYDPFLTKDVRIDDLLSHRVGLETADLLAYRGDYDRAEILRRLRYLQPVVPFRSRFGYHNHMVTTAGEVLERICGQPWATVLRTRLLQLLGMSATYASPRELQGLENLATPHLLAEGKLIVDTLWNREAVHEGFARLHEAVAPAGAMQSSVVDLAKFLQMTLDEGTVSGRPFLKPDTVRTMLAQHSSVPLTTTRNSNPAYPQLYYGGALGWQLRDIRGRKVAMHGGSSGAIIAIMPEENIGLAVLTNRGSGLEYMFMHDVFARVLGLPRVLSNRDRDWLVEAQETPANHTADRNARLDAARTKDTRPSLPLHRYAGAYECDLYGKLEIRESDGSLQVQLGPNISGTPVHWEHDTFRAKLSFPPGEEWFIRFQVADGNVGRLTIERLSWHEPMPEFVRVE
jgi:CubicO group peptidase (beta-lactamase class C family)